ncbi:MAG: hypothetical protein A3F13_02240 [Gammaproteobacteria bacterium RIFCSPHIGHO2_12_FULL_40_19]|nr:MAG: hypothetical protein A3F13_02240 [Gammaproteobacteria bacterium RIFCSPHIGHO2_12_FULL_40_19]
MSIDDKMKEQLAKELFNATRNKCSLSCITIVYPDLTVSEAYQIQHQGMLLRLENREKIVGFKMGLTLCEITTNARNGYHSKLLSIAT